MASFWICWQVRSTVCSRVAMDFDHVFSTCSHVLCLQSDAVHKSLLV